MGPPSPRGTILAQGSIFDDFGVSCGNPSPHSGSIFELFDTRFFFYRFLETPLGGSFHNFGCHLAPKWKAFGSYVWSHVFDPWISILLKTLTVKQHVLGSIAPHV